MLEAGVPDHVSESWWGALVPAGTPAPVMRRLGEVIGKILPEADTRQRFAALGIEPLSMPIDEFRIMIRTEYATWAKIIKEIGIASQ